MDLELTAFAGPIALASDHAGIGMKADLFAALVGAGIETVDLGPETADRVDYPDYADKLAEWLVGRPSAAGVLICGTGIGISIAANRHDHVRAALAHDITTARLSREHNDANVLALGARTLGPEIALDCLSVFLTTGFGHGRHTGRVAKLSAR